MAPGYLFCSDPLRASRPDPAFADEVAGARRSGGDIALVDHDALIAGDSAGALGRVPRGSGPYWYRGWMIPVLEYEVLSRGLRERGRALLTMPDRFGRAHELPGWYALFADRVTTDLAPREDGRWRVVEVGDGQVSGLPAGADATLLFDALTRAGGRLTG
ncbi:ATP-grasp domain-containing protein [Streptomyces sp. H27-C3]|uniref:ATP-grasp domain-containing protein n=1 Tax=Streptomyces sp. H27-C3 TaxID=3046305 RepID=UPI0024BB989D|nr:ATP-grasp domain-containing protein [Streptomyces sp. H27-C3]MDJ0462379.1 ATP-grasp domain-containing protein [Streptomyces sp. H27-C3]